MIPCLRALRLLSIVTWLGGIIFFAFVLAPTVFHVLPTTHEAGMVVSATLDKLHRIGLTCGMVFLVATVLQWSMTQTRGRRRLFSGLILVLLMIGATGYIQARIIPAMERDRIAAGGDVDAAPADNPARLDFERLHPISEKVEGFALLLGIALVLVMATERSPA